VEIETKEIELCSKCQSIIDDYTEINKLCIDCYVKTNKKQFVNNYFHEKYKLIQDE